MRLHVAAFAVSALFVGDALGAESHLFSCDADALGQKTSNKALAAAFGAENVHMKKEMDSEGALGPVTRVLAGKGREILEVDWFDPPSRKGAHVISTKDKSYFRGPHGLHVGMTVAEVEAINGKPFEFESPQMDLGAGEVSDWKGGALQGVMKGCGFQVTLWTETDKTREMALMSNDPLVRASKFTVEDMRLVFDYPGGK